MYWEGFTTVDLQIRETEILAYSSFTSNLGCTSNAIGSVGDLSTLLDDRHYYFGPKSY